jgi:ethanolamine ammonia-lyase large subunit
MCVVLSGSLLLFHRRADIAAAVAWSSRLAGAEDRFRAAPPLKGCFDTSAGPATCGTGRYPADQMAKEGRIFHMNRRFRGFSVKRVSMVAILS